MYLLTKHFYLLMLIWKVKLNSSVFYPQTILSNSLKTSTSYLYLSVVIAFVILVLYVLLYQLDMSISEMYKKYNVFVYACL